MGTEIHYTDAEVLCENLLKQYDAMDKNIKNFERVISQYRESLDDKIMQRSEELLNSIKQDMVEINKYISEFTKNKKTALNDLGLEEEAFLK